MGKPMGISIVILTFNRLEMLRGLLSSLFKIKYRPLEIIVIDNHSDEPIEEALKAEFPGVVVLEMEKNIGVGGRNRGILLH